MSKIPHANRPGAYSNNDPDGDTFGVFLSGPMEDKPMTIRIQLFDHHGILNDTHDILVHGEDDMEGKIGVALSKLALHTWYLSPGDVIRINEV